MELLSECRPLLAVVNGVREHPFRAGLTRDGDHQPLLLQLLHQVHEPAALLPEQIHSGHTAVFKHQLGRVLRREPHLLEFLPANETRCVAFHDEERDCAMRVVVATSLRRHHDQVRQLSVRDEGLCAIDDPLLAAATLPWFESRQGDRCLCRARSSRWR